MPSLRRRKLKSLQVCTKNLVILERGEILELPPSLLAILLRLFLQNNAVLNHSGVAGGWEPCLLKREAIDRLEIRFRDESSLSEASWRGFRRLLRVHDNNFVAGIFLEPLTAVLLCLG